MCPCVPLSPVITLYLNLLLTVYTLVRILPQSLTKEVHTRPFSLFGIISATNVPSILPSTTIVQFLQLLHPLLWKNWNYLLPHLLIVHPTTMKTIDFNAQEPTNPPPSNNDQLIQTNTNSDTTGTSGLVPLPIISLYHCPLICITTTTDLQWSSAISLSTHRSSHPLDTSCSIQDSTNLRRACQHPPHSTFIYLASNCQEQVTILDLRNLLSHNQMISHRIMNSFLNILATQFHLAYLDASFYSILHQQGWNAVRKWFTGTPPRFLPRSPRRPLLQSDHIISILCHVHGCHWVAVTRHVIGRIVTFLYSDDLNDSSTEQSIRNT